MNAGDLDCDRALALLQDYLKSEADPSLIPLIERHLEACVGCVSHARFERNFLLVLQARAADVRCPESLRARIAEALRQE
jgi:anti-sigma factor (TIGR02949 family)